MNAYCRTERTYDDFDRAAYELAGIFASRGFGTAQHREAVAALREILEHSASSPPLPRTPPATGEGEPPPGSPHYREGNGLRALNAELRALLWASHSLLQFDSYEDHSAVAAQVRLNRTFFAKSQEAAP
jgi:hypothetical protein